tara:strand:- start:1121 stop:1276 length:156 start_codon:yes stop_codon:yes gene_type:complete
LDTYEEYKAETSSGSSSTKVKANVTKAKTSKTKMNADASPIVKKKKILKRK